MKQTVLVKKKQFELTEKSIKLGELVAKFKAKVMENLKHISNIEWLNLMRNIDIATVPPNAIVIMTDFAATMDLRAIETVNCSVDNHAWLVNFIVISNKRSVPIDGKREFFHDCDVFQYLGCTMNKGKKNDYISHGACLRHVLNHYIQEFAAQGKVLEMAILWTDNCGNQYKCKECFSLIWLTYQEINVRILHNFAVKDNFKGVWDGAGKVAKDFIAKMEEEQIRSPNALACFQNMKNNEKQKYEVDEREKFKLWEATGDKRLLQKKDFTTSRRIIGYATESEEEYHSLSQEYPGCIVFTQRDPTKVPTLTKHLKGTHDLHEVSFCPRPKNSRAVSTVHYLNTAHRPCRCFNCREGMLNSDGPVLNNCTYKHQRGSIKSYERAILTFKKTVENYSESDEGSCNSSSVLLHNEDHEQEQCAALINDETPPEVKILPSLKPTLQSVVLAVPVTFSTATANADHSIPSSNLPMNEVETETSNAKRIVHSSSTSDFDEAVWICSNTSRETSRPSLPSPSMLEVYAAQEHHATLEGQIQSATLLVYPFPGSGYRVEMAASGLKQCIGLQQKIFTRGELNKLLKNACSGRNSQITITEDDRKRLEPGVFYNDAIIDFWMKW